MGNYGHFPPLTSLLPRRLLPRVDVKPSSLLFWGLSAPPPWGSCSCSPLTPAHGVQFSPLPYTGFAPRLVFARSESFSLCSRSALRCQTLGRSRPGLAGLVPLMEKASVSNITVPPRFRHCHKSSCYGPFVGCG